MAYQPKSYKKFVATAATATLVASAVVPVALAAKPAAEFSDVAPQYKEAVDYLVDNSLAAGKTPSTFGTAEPIIRVDAAIWIAKATLTEGEISAAPASDFTDVPDRGVIYVDALKSKGYVNGTDATSFNSYANISRGEVAMILAEAYDITGNTSNNKFTDVNSRYLAAVSALKDNGITSGKTSTRFGTGDAITRGELAIWVYKLETLDAVTVSNLNVAVDGSNATVTADVKNVEDNTDATVSVYPNGNLSATPIVNTTKVVGGRVSSVFNDVPTGTHTVVVKVGEISSSKSFSIDSAVVSSVSSLNATQLQVKFSQAVNEDSLFLDANGTFNAGVVTLTSLDGNSPGTLKGELSADGMTLVITSQNTLAKRYDIKLDGLESEAGVDFPKYSQMLSISADTSAPVILGSERISASQVLVKFSEPLKAFSNVEYSYADGSVLASGAVTGSIAAGSNELLITMGANVTANKELVATIIGAQDQNGNLLSPNPAKVSFVKGAADGVAPAVTSIDQSGPNKFAIKFTEQLLSAPTVTVSGGTVSSVVKDSSDATRYIVTVAGVLEGATTVSYSNFTDLSGQAGTAGSQVKTFVKDAVAPKLLSTKVVVNSTTGKEVLELTFDKDVKVDGTSSVNASGSYVKDFITTSFPTTTSALTYADASNKKVVRLTSDQDSFLGANDVEGATYDLDLAFTNVKSLSDVVVTSGETKFTRGKDGTPSSVAVVDVNSVAQSSTNNNLVVVTFDKAVDGASATNTANYSIAGAVIDSVTLNPVSSDGTQQAVLNLRQDSNTFTGVRNINISNVKALGSNKTMDPYFTNTVSLKENVAPKVTSAKLTAVDKVTLTFSEAVTSNAAFDFEVLVGGGSQSPVENANLITTASGTTQVLTIQTVDATELSKGISLKALSNLDIIDASGNKVSVPSNIIVSQ
jgi:hypothetical protein